uniref:Triple functional domain protein n=2 Tax=Lygus hesperus TaxID=30085 RepID=A0A146KTA1_LYGHE
MTREEEEKILSNRQCVLEELVRTEHTYVKHLKMVVEGYLALTRDPDGEVPVPDDWDTTSEYNTFSNMESIYNWHKNVFLKELERCLTDVNELGLIFERNERKMMSMYTRYTHNHDKQKPAVLDKFGEYFYNLAIELDYSQQMDELLFKPIQRITVYHLLMDRIYGSTKKLKRPTECESVQRALKVVKDLPHNINVMMKFRDVMGYKDGNEDNGKLVYHGLLLCAEGEVKNAHKKSAKKTVYYKGEPFMVYLFEKNVLFNVVVGKNVKNNEPRCFYRNHIPVNNMLFGKVPNCINTFTIRSMRVEFATTSGDPDSIIGENPKGECLAYTCRAETSESFAEWIHAIETVSAQQYDFAGALENPRAHQTLRS